MEGGLSERESYEVSSYPQSKMRECHCRVVRVNTRCAGTRGFVITVISEAYVEGVNMFRIATEVNDLLLAI